MKKTDIYIIIIAFITGLLIIPITSVYIGILFLFGASLPVVVTKSYFKHKKVVKNRPINRGKLCNKYGNLAEIRLIISLNDYISSNHLKSTLGKTNLNNLTRQLEKYANDEEKINCIIREKIVKDFIKNLNNVRFYEIGQVLLDDDLRQVFLTSETYAEDRGAFNHILEEYNEIIKTAKREVYKTQQEVKEDTINSYLKKEGTK